jgi:PAS domain S-box-containing protein
MSLPSPDFAGPKRLSARWIPVMVLVLGMGVTLAAWSLVSRELKAASAGRFERMREHAASLMEQQFRALEQALYAGRSLAQRPGPITQAEWRAFAGNMERFLDRQVVGLGYIERVDRANLAALEARIRADGLPDFSIERAGTAPQAYVVTHLEPRESNAAALGLDIGAGNTRRLAAEEAMRTARPVLSRRIQIVEGSKHVPGCLFLLPVYAGADDPGAPEARTAALRGWVYVSIRVDRLIAGALASLADLVECEVYEGATATADTLLYDSHGTADMTDATWPVRNPQGFNASDQLEFYGQSWMFRLNTRPGFDTLSSSQLPWVILGSGLMATLLGTGLTWTLVNSRARGIALAERMTTDLRQAEAQAARLAVVARHAGTGIMLIGSDHRIEWVNESFSRCYGYSPEDAIGRLPGELLHGSETSPGTLAALRRSIESGQPFHGEVLNYTKSREPVWIELDLRPLQDASGKLTGYMAMQVDITERRRQSDELRQAMDTARRADQAKSQFLAMMSHEIRTPMNGVIGMTSLLLDSPLSREQRDYVETIRQSGDALLGIINEILDFSKIESGRLELAAEPCGLRECLESTLDLLAPKAAEKQLDLLYELDERVPYTVRTDQTRLRQILVNLLGNAIKFTLRGEVLLTVRAAERPDGRVELRFAVRDTGIGIAPEALPRLFQPFSQLDASTARRFGGTGLGLAISQRLAGLLGGTMWVESVLGQGSTFHFTILTQEVPGRPSAEEPRGMLGGLRVLLVDDNATSRRILGGLLARWGVAPVGVESGAEALRQLEGDRPFDVAILDLHMPVMDGAALARAIRSRNRPAPLPLVLLCHAGQREQLAEPGIFAACVTKPVKPSPLVDALTRIFRDRAVETARPAAPFVPRPVAAARPTERVLVAEDNKVNLKVTLLMLQKLGYEADVAGDGIAVIEAVRRQHYDVILMDVQMPGLDGLEVTRRIRAGAAGRPDKVWIIAVTANAMEGDRQSCLAAGMDDYVTKPIDILELEWALVRAHHALSTP